MRLIETSIGSCCFVGLGLSATRTCRLVPHMHNKTRRERNPIRVEVIVGTEQRNGALKLTLLVNLVILTIRRVGVVSSRVAHLAIALLVDHPLLLSILSLAVSGLVTDGWELGTNTTGVSGSLGALRRIGWRSIDLVLLRSQSFTLFGGLALSFLLLLASLPFLANFLKFCDREVRSATRFHYNDIREGRWSSDTRPVVDPI